MRTRRILVCAPVMPEFDRESGSRRIFHLILLLREAGWSVTFYAENMTGGQRYARILRQHGVMVYGGIHSRGISDEYLPNPKVLFETGHFDLVLVAFWYFAEALLPLLREYAPQTRLIVDSIDLHFLRQARQVYSQDTTAAKTLALDYASEMIRELNTYAAADGVLTVSQKEADLINDFLATPNRAFAIPDMEELTLSPVPFEERKGILFVGNFRHLPNVEAVHYLFKEIVPRLDPQLLQRHPLYVVGNAMNAEIHRLGADKAGVQMVGWVPSVLPYFNQSRISIVPLTYGAGTKRKVIEALSIGTPCVSTGIGVEGMDLEDGKQVLIANDPEAFATSIARLLEDRSLWQTLQEHGRSHIVATHGKAFVRQQLDHVLDHVLATTPLEAPPAHGLPWLTEELSKRMYRAKVGVKHVLRTMQIRAQLK